MWNLPRFCKSSNINSLRTLKCGILSQFIDNFALQTTKGKINASLKTKSLPESLQPHLGYFYCKMTEWTICALME